MSKVASAANAMGVDIDQMNAMLSTTISVTREAPESVGTAYKTILSRMSTIQAGDTAEDGATLTSYTKKMNALGVNVLDANNRFREMGDVVEEVGGKWSSFSKEQQLALAQVMAGTRQYNNLIALFDNWDMYQDALKMSAEAAGTLNKQQEIYMESTQAHLQTLSTALEGVFDSILSGEDINEVVDDIVPIVHGIESIIDAIGGGTGALQLFAPMLLKSFSPEIAQQILTIHHNLQAVESNKQALDNLHETIATFTHIEGLDGATEQLSEYMQQLDEYANFMTPEEFEEQKKHISDLGKAYEEYGQARIDTEKALSKLQNALGDKDVTRDNYKEKVEQAEDARKKITKLNKVIYDQGDAKTDSGLKAIGASSYIDENDWSDIEKMNQATNALQASIKDIQNAIQELANDPASTEIKEKFEELNSKIKNDTAPQEVKKIYDEIIQTISEAAVNGETRLEEIGTALEDNVDELVVAEERARQASEAAKQATAEGFSDEQLKNFTEGVVELSSSIWQAGAAAVNFVKNWQDIWDNDDLTNGEKFAQTLQLIAINASLVGNGISSARKAITQLASTYRASVASKVTDTAASIAQAEANKEVAGSARNAADAVNEDTKADRENTKSSLENASANKIQAQSLQGNNQHTLLQDTGDAAKGIGKTAKAGIEKIGAIGKAGASSESLIGGMSTFAAGITTLSALAVAAASVYIAYKRISDAVLETERAVESAQSSYDKAKEALSNINSEVLNLNTAINEIDEEKASLSTLTRGTSEWKEQLDKVNESVATLIEQFPELKKYATFKNGAWTISEEDLNKFQEEKQEEQKTIQNLTYGTEAALTSAKMHNINYQTQMDSVGGWEAMIGNTATFTTGGALIGTLFGGPLGAILGGLAGAGLSAYDINKTREETATNIDYDKNRGSAAETQSILDKFRVSSEEERKALKQELANTFSGIDANDSTSQIEKYLSNLIELQEAQNELDEIYKKNTQALLENNFGEEIVSKIEEQGITDERQQSIIKDAIERRSSEGLEATRKTVQDNLLTENGSINKESGMGEAFKKYIREAWAAQNGVDLDDVEITGEGGNTFHIKDTTGKADTEKFDYKEWAEAFAAQYVASGEAGEKETNKWLKTFSATGNTFYTALLDEVTSGNLEMNELTQKEKDTLQKMLENNEIYNTETQDILKQILEEDKQNQNTIRDSITSSSGQEAYDKALKLEGAENLTDTDYQQLADKINSIYSEAGKEGIEEFERQIQGQHISVALNIDIGNVKDKITAEAQQILDDAKIDAETFKIFRENANVEGKEYSDEQLARTLAAQSDLNKIYKERKTIFKALQDAKIDQLTGEQQGYIVSLQKALSTLTGMDLQADDIVNNIDLISKYFSGGEEGLPAINDFITKMNEKYSDVTAVFEKFSDIRVGTSASETGLANEISAIADRLDYTESQIRALYYSKGFLFNNTTGQYEKVEDVQYILNMVSTADNKYSVGDVVATSDKASLDELLEDYGVETTSELEKLGWKLTTISSGMWVWEKTTNLSDIYNYSEQGFRVNKNGETETLQKFTGEIKAGQIQALQAQEYFYNENGLEGAGWYKWVDLYDIINQKTIGNAVDPDKTFDQSKDSSTKTTKEEKKITHKYDINYDTQDNLIKAKEKELERLQEVEDDLIGEDLLQNLEDQKKYYEDILKLQREKLDLTKKDVETQKSNLITATNGEIKFDEDTGYTLNSAELLKQAEAKTNAARQDYNAHKDEDAETLNSYSEALTKAENEETELKEFIDNYNKAIDTSKDVADELDEINAKISEINVSSQIKVANQELEKAISHMSSLNDIINTTVSEFQKLSGPEAMEAFNKFIEQSNKLEDTFNAQKEAFHNSADTVFNLAKDLTTSGLASGDMGFIGEMQDFFKSDKNIFNQSAYVEYTERAKEELSKAKAELSKAVTEDDKKKAQEAADTWAAIVDWLKEAATNAKTLQQNMDNIYLTSGEIGSTFEDWQVSSIDVQIDRISKKINKIAREGKKLKGQDLINNILRQNDEIKKQIKLEKSKLGILKAQMMLKRTMLELQIQEFTKTLGITNLTIQYDKKTGQITAESFKRMNDVIAAGLAGAGELGAAAQQQWNLLQQSFESYQQSVSAVQSSLDAIDSFEDSIEDNFQSIKDAMKEMRDKALEIFNAKVDVEVDIEEAWRKLNRLEAKMNKIKDNDFLGQAQLDAYDAQSYLTANPNSYFGDAGGGSIQILTTHVNDIMGEIDTMLGGGTSSLYGKNQTQAFSDLRNYADQLMSQVEAFYDALDAVRQKYSACVDAILNKNKELLDDISKINDLNNQGINITKLLYGDNSFDKLQSYYTNIADNTKRLLEESVKQKEYYANFMKQFSPDSDEYAQAKSAYQESMTQVYEYGQQLLEQYAQELMNKVSMYEQKMKDSLANLSGFADTLLSDQDWEYQTKLINDYLDDTNAAYEMNKLQNKFQTAIDDTDVVSSKKELTKVMNEQLGILEKQLEDGQLLTKYDIDRANKVYELTLKQIALEEAQNNKSKMRLRRDSQGNYRYEFVADLDKVNQAKQELADAQNDLYNLDKDRTVEMINEIKSLQSEYYNYRKSIIEDDYLSEEEKKQALEELYNKYYGVPEGLLYMANAEYQQARDNMESDTDANIEFYAKTTAEALAQNWDDVAAAEKKSNDQIIADIAEQQIKVNEALDLMKQGYDSLEESIQNDVSATENLIDADQELLNQYAQQLLAIKDLMDELEALEDHYKSVMEAAKQALETSLLLRQNSWEDDETDDSISSSKSSKDKDSTDDIDTTDDNTEIGNHIRQSKTGKMYVKQSWWDSLSPKRQQDWLNAISDYQGKSYENIVISDNEFKKKWGNRKITEHISFDTGGYTGEWGKEGKMAMLHEKELVLNKDDTKNILQTVDITRNLISSLAELKSSFASSLATLPQAAQMSSMTQSSNLQQEVHIEAVFPNVSEKSEIEEAFNNLVNLASQRAMSTKK